MIALYMSALSHLGVALKDPPKLDPPKPFSTAVASWYYDAGQTASGWHSFYGVANRTLAFGTKVLFAYHGRRVLATVQDRGPFVAGRLWDLNENVAGALGFAGVDVVSYRIGG
jgi:rare lipoprotein A (peptidoglycan hydrolase)